MKEAAAALGARAPGVGGRYSLEPGSSEARVWAAIVRIIEKAVADGTVRSDLTPLDLLVLVAGVPRDPATVEVRDRYVDIVIDGMRTRR